MKSLPAKQSYFNIEKMERLFSRHLRAVMKQRGKTAYRLAKDTGFSEGHISNLLSGKRDATPEVVRKIGESMPGAFEELQAWADADEVGMERVAALAQFVLNVPPRQFQDALHSTRTVRIQGKTYVVPDEMEDAPDSWEISLLEQSGGIDSPDFDPRQDAEIWYLPREKRKNTIVEQWKHWAEQQPPDKQPAAQ